MVSLNKRHSRRKRKTHKKRTQRGGGCACAGPIVGGKRRKRKSRRRRRSRRRTRRHHTYRRKQKGGNLLAKSGFTCNYPTDVGETFTGIKYNRNPSLPDPINNNSNSRIQQKFKSFKKGGRHKLRKNKNQKGGGRMLSNFGFGDLLLGYYKGSNAAADAVNTYKGRRHEVSADPMKQQYEPRDKLYTPFDMPKAYNTGALKASEYTIN